MWSVMKNSTLPVAGFLVLFAGGSARAATIEVKVPFPFVVQSQTLPAGQYRVDRDAVDPSVVHIRGEKNITATVFVLTQPASGHDPEGQKPALTFTRHETQYRLSDIWESGTEGREVVPRR